MFYYILIYINILYLYFISFIFLKKKKDFFKIVYGCYFYFPLLFFIL